MAANSKAYGDMDFQLDMAWNMFPGEQRSLEYMVIFLYHRRFTKSKQKDSPLSAIRLYTMLPFDRSTGRRARHKQKCTA